ncbi:DHH family phosphoesterase [Halorubrum cibi]|uniref:NanoRNase/pAp phosphatase, hydrolyzes c-di-AMP and oligoRNAs n=1 Tax=Halorubrum cibi TaxID=413815 RepID=A0A521AWM4_9EURY|nr:DHH family phosphoesterase [Halorubrum cibi]SMO38970.1 nanoRNase/pAp phosphatase, hydrolyzes c-di-AMP and oligoRNAs [Halorubrum cibi]
MVRRLLLGCSAVGNSLVERVAEGSEDLLAVTDDAGWASTLRDRNVATVEADPTDPSSFPERAAVVLVASDDPARNVAAASAARDRYPDAMIVAHVGTAPTAEQVDALESVADRVVDPVEAVATRVRDAVGLDELDSGTDHAFDRSAISTRPPGATERPPRLIRTIRGLSGPLLVVAHDNPDPDAIASAVGLARIAESVGVSADPCYGGEIAHQENRAMVNLLDLSLSTVDGIDLESYGGIALVDHSRAGINDSLPEGTPVDVVIDHHPPRGPVEGTFVDVRPDAGATSTLIEEYLSRLGIDPDRALATALLYGIRIDTRDFTREVSIPDFEAAASLTPHVDESTLDRVESPSVSPETLRVLATAIGRRDVRGSTVASCVGEITDRDALAQAADRLLDLEGIAVTFVYGYMDGVIYGSARARGTDLDVGELLRDALAQAGSAGGHANMAGAQVPFGILETVAEDESLADVVEEFVAGRFFEALSESSAPPTGTTPEAIDADFPE